VFDAETRYDVAVLGGGLCGFAAARSLARAGARVLLVERRPVLGWEATWAFRLDLHEATCEAAQWFRDAMAAAGGCRNGFLDAPIAEIVLDKAASDAGMEVLLYAQPVAVAQQGDLVSGVLLGTKSGEVLVRARAFVDATENALLWRLAGGVVERPGRIPARHALFLNHVAGPAPEGPRSLGDLAGCREVVLRPGVWPGEAAVEFGIAACDVRLARRMLPDLLRSLREQVDGLDRALVTGVGVEPYPLAGPCQREDVGFRHAAAANLFGAAPWVMPEEAPPDGWSLDGRLRLGEFAADAVGMALGSLPEPGAPAPLPHSRVAPPTHEADVVVCGGGTGGALAAIAAARQGASTILIEASTGLGGIGTGGGIHVYYHGVAGGLQDEVDQCVAELSPLFGPAQGFHPEAKKLALELLAAEAGVRIVYETTLTGAHSVWPSATAECQIPDSRCQTRSGQDRGVLSRTLEHELERATPEGRRVRAVVAAGPEGNAMFRGKVFVDATGDGDLAAMAGAEFTFGRAADGLPHAYSLAAGRLGEKGELQVTNFDAGYCDPTDVADLARARRHALGHYRRERYEAANRLLYIAPILGLRNSRQVVGDYRLTLADEIAGREFPDVIAYAYSHFDNHGFDYENESDEAMLWVWLLGNWGRRIGCEIPYRTLLPAGVEGLLMACRALSLTHDAHNQLRMQRDLQRIGEAAGIAAALAARRGVTPRALPVADLQAALLATGALGPRAPQAGSLCHPLQSSAAGGTGILPVGRRLPAAPAAGTPKRGLGVAPEAEWREEEGVPRANFYSGDTILNLAGSTHGVAESERGIMYDVPRIREAGPPAPIGPALHESSWMPPQVPALPLAERVEQLGTDKAQEATFDLIRRGDAALPLLLQAAKAERPATRFWASVALAMAGRPEAGPELRAALAARRADVPGGHKAAPLWRSAAILLGRIGDREAVPELCRVLADRSADIDALIAAVRALGRIGDASAIPAIEALVERPDLPTQRQLQVSVAAANPVVEDARWQLDLAAAEVLARLGHPRPDLAERHARDDRALVRRHARRVAELSGAGRQ